MNVDDTSPNDDVTGWGTTDLGTKVGVALSAWPATLSDAALAAPLPLEANDAPRGARLVELKKVFVIWAVAAIESDDAFENRFPTL